MKNLLVRTLVGSSLLLGGLTANAQYERPRDYGYQDREYRGHTQLLGRVQADLDRVEAGTLPFTGDRSRIIAVRQQVNAFQRRLADGEYDRRELDNAITGIERVVDMNRMSDSRRDDLVSDLARLRELRERLDREER